MTSELTRGQQISACYYCGRTGQLLGPCCGRAEHEHQLACADVAGCRDHLLAELSWQQARSDGPGDKTGLTSQDRTDMVSAMTADEWSWMVAFIAGYRPQVFDAAVAARSATFADELADRIDDEEDDEPEAYCKTCGADLGIFHGHGGGWHHFRGEGTVASPVELFDAGHALVVGWRWPDE